MSNRPDSPLGKFLGLAGFAAGFSIGWQNSEHNLFAALIVGFIVAALGTLIGNVITGVLIVAAALAVAILSGVVRRAVIQEVVVPIISEAASSSEPFEPTPEPTQPSTPQKTEIPGGPPVFVSNVLKVCNETSDSVIVAIGYRENEIWRAKGWYRVESSQCSQLISDAPSPIYAYATSDGWGEGKFWITDKDQAKFCVDSRNAFELSDGPCEEGAHPDYRFQEFGEVIVEHVASCTWALEPSTWRLECVDPLDSMS